MFRRFALVGIMALILASCGGDDSSEKESPAATEATAASGKGVTAVEATKAALGLDKGKTRDETRVHVDLSEEGDTFDFTIAVIDGSGY